LSAAGFSITLAAAGLAKPTGLTVVLSVAFIAYSIIIHEIAHGYAALKFGDTTARDLGRITLNPLKHIDPIGTIVFPAIQVAIFGQFFIGWAKPVPVNPQRLQPKVAGDLTVSLAGIFVNLLLALLCAVLLGLTAVIPPGTPLYAALVWTLFANVALAIFNLLPIPPLDGSHVFKYLLPVGLRRGYQRVGFFGILILLLLIQMPQFDTIFFTPIRAVIGVLAKITAAVNGALG
jgi:Zn-dependent protease